MTNGPTAAAPPRAGIPHAATVLLLREAAGRLQVLMTKRAAGLSFMANLWVFPGGRIDPCDLAPELEAHADAAAVADKGSRMLDATTLQPIDPTAARGLLVGACRETYEEAGVLLARPRAQDAAWGDAGRERIAARRASACANASGFVRVLADEDLALEVEGLVYWAHWITPAHETKRFDTRFFALALPAGEVASVDNGELTQHAWIDEEAADAGLANGTMRMAPPTRLTLRDLWQAHARHGNDLAAMLAGERTRVVPPILPKRIAVVDGEVEIALPWDARYADAPGEGAGVLPHYPEYLTALPSSMRFPARY